jgi:hypothetical protein
MEPNSITSSGNSSIPITVVTTGENSPNLPLSTVRATMVSAATTSHSGPTPSIAAATPPYTPSATGPPFSYGMPSSSTSPALTSSTLQTLGLGAGSSNAPLQGQLGGIPVPFNAFPYAGGHIPPSSPSLGGSASAVRHAACTHKSFWSRESRNTCANSAGRFITICLEWDVW